MLAAGVPLLTALEIVKKVLNNTVLEKVVEEARDAIREGESIAAPLKRSGQFPSMMVHMVAVGERSGSSRRCWRTSPAPTNATSRARSRG